MIKLWLFCCIVFATTFVIGCVHADSTRFDVMHKQLDTELRLIGEFSRSLSQEQRTMAVPPAIWHKGRIGEISGGLTWEKMTVSQRTKISQACRMRTSLDAQKPVAARTIIYYEWNDPVTRTKRGLLRWSNGGLLLGAQMLDAEQATHLFKETRVLAENLVMSLEPEQRKKLAVASDDAWKGGVPFSELYPAQQELFLNCMILELAGSGESVGHLASDMERWRIVKDKSSGMLFFMLGSIGHGFEIKIE